MLPVLFPNLQMLPFSTLIYFFKVDFSMQYALG